MAKRVRRSKTWVGPVRRLFPPGTAALNNQLARLYVLYEDLKIETLGMAARRRTFLDAAGTRYRLHYFVRAALSTFREAHSAFVGLDQNPDFRRMVLGVMDAEAKAEVKAAIKFFGKNAAQIRKARNLVGGHFSKKAAQSALASLAVDDPTSKVEIEANRAGTGAGITLHFAEEIALRAMTSGAEKGQDAVEYYRSLAIMLAEAHGHFARAMHRISLVRVIPQLGQG